MGKKTAIFALNDFVYAKVKGYSPWPAKIIKVIAKHKYKVYFYGTKETGNCKSEDLEPYDEKNRSKLNTEKQMKKADYKQAVDEIEAAIQGNDSAPSSADIQNAPVNESIADNTQEDISHNDNDTSEIDPDESRLQIAEDAPKSTPVQQAKKRAPTVKKNPVLVSPPVIPLESESKENDEKVSRSGRKIKEKKINNDEMDPDDVFTQPRKRLKTDESIIKNNSKPATPLNDSTINDFCLSKMHVVEDPLRKNFFMTQFEMIKLVQDVKLGLGLEEANVEKSLESLKTLQEKVVPNVTKLMLLKYPNIITTVKKLRNYIGNVASWNLEEAQLVEFQEKAKQIRNIAEEIYNSFKKQFTDLPENASFWDFFMDEQKQFSERFQKLDVADLFEAISIEELETFVNKLTENDDAQVPQINTVDIAQEIAT